MKKVFLFILSICFVASNEAMLSHFCHRAISSSGLAVRGIPQTAYSFEFFRDKGLPLNEFADRYEIPCGKTGVISFSKNGKQPLDRDVKRVSLSNIDVDELDSPVTSAYMDLLLNYNAGRLENGKRVPLINLSGKESPDISRPHYFSGSSKALFDMFKNRSDVFSNYTEILKVLKRACSAPMCRELIYREVIEAGRVDIDNGRGITEFDSFMTEYRNKNRSVVLGAIKEGNFFLPADGRYHNAATILVDLFNTSHNLFNVPCLHIGPDGSFACVPMENISQDVVDKLQVVYFAHEFLHFFLHTRAPSRVADEYMFYRGSTDSSRDISFVYFCDKLEGQRDKKREAATAYLWLTEHMVNIDGQKKEMVARKYINGHEMRVILGAPGDKRFHHDPTCDNNKMYVEHTRYFPGDNLSENALRYHYKLPLRLTYVVNDDVLFSPDARIVDRICKVVGGNGLTEFPLFEGKAFQDCSFFPGLGKTKLYYRKWDNEFFNWEMAL